MNGHTAAGAMDYAARLETFSKADAERNALVAEILRNYEELNTKYAEKCDDYNNEVESRRMWQSKARTSELALSEHKVASVCDCAAHAPRDIR